MRAAIYARVSSEEQVQGYSLDAQLRACRQFASAHDWEVAHEFVEEGRSARTDDVNKRPQFKLMMDEALTGGFEVIVVHKLDRFSRNLRVTLEHFERLAEANVSFTSITENMDFSSPWGKFALTMLGGLAQLYSDNLGLEVKKGKAERKAQGLYNGLLPFGMMKGEDGVPVVDSETFPGLEMAFQLAASGKSDKQIAVALNRDSYRTAGNQGNRLFSKDTVRGMLTNRFYLGTIRSNNEWLPAKHNAVIDEHVFLAASDARKRNNNNSGKHTRSDARVSSLSGVARCYGCGATLRTMRNRGIARLVCNTRLKRGACTEKSARLSLYEDHLDGYLTALRIPKDKQAQLAKFQKDHADASDQAGHRRRELTGMRARVTDLYRWGDIDRSQYVKESQVIDQELESLPEEAVDQATLDKAAEYLGNVASAWGDAHQEQRNKLSRTLFDSVWIKDQSVVGVTQRLS